MKEPFIIENEDDVDLLRDCVVWFLKTQDPELDDSVYDGNDRIILRDELLPRLSHPLDVNDGTCKDLGLLVQCLEAALAEGIIERHKAEELLQRLKDYGQRERRRLSQG